MPGSTPRPTVVIGAGPAGLTAAYQLGQARRRRSRCSRPTTSSAASAGPSSATAGASTSAATASSPRCPQVEELWHEILPDEDFLHAAPDEPHLLRRQVLRLPAQGDQRAAQPRRRSRRSAASAVVRCGRGSVRRRTRPHFEGWVVARFGWRLYRHFFKTYTEKVWGVPATEIQADWAAQRIKSLSLLQRRCINALLAAGATRPGRSPASSRSSSTRSTAPG